ncbi:swt1 RNA endoribonuclease isoform X2 [Megalopta genalis]|uniref:swt1 RNA endoribonuclease isoform X2 n=1 Tax=Megalopta genalis TaxID=115081 RepID=UPI0014434C43|nr:transcriptional protein SWT1 isoform X2 [Megalopta genalis]
MMKQDLPKHWIVLNSKTHPERVYYFNVKTNQSSWEAPTTERSEQIVKKTRRHKNMQPTTPEHEAPEKEIKERKKLVAKRSLKRSMEETNEQKETPQMRAIREKILAKKERENTSKTRSPNSSKNNTKSSIATNKEILLNEIDESSKTACTPQMQVILEKIRERKSKSKSKVQKIDLNKDNSNKSPQNLPVKQTKGKKDKEKKDQRRKTCDPSLIAMTTTKRNRRSLKNNMGKERMEKLRKSLTMENSINESSDSAIGHSQSSSMVHKHVAKDKLPSIYKNIEVRLTRLKDKVSKTKVPINTASNNDKPKILSVETVATENNLVNRSNENSIYEEMEWEPLEDEKITFEVQAVRTQLCTVNNADVSCSVPNYGLSYPLISEQQEKKQLYVVVDTNVFLSNIDAIELMKESTFKTFDHPFIVIPWTVIRELDYIKNDNGKTKPASLSMKARKAVNYINKLFSSKYPYIIGQTREDALRNKKKYSIDCPDDEILQTCLQIRELEKSVVLMSYDTNLCNKAMIYDITALGRNDPLEKVDYLNALNYTNNLSASFNEKRKDLILSKEQHILNDIFDEIKNTVKDFLTVIVSKEMYELYGGSWEKHVIVEPPWTAVTVLQCAIKHWIAAVSESFQRKGEAVLKELLQIFRDRSGDKKLSEIGYILNKCTELIQMVNTDKHGDLMLRASRKIDELRQQCRTFENQLNYQKLQDAIGLERDVTVRERRAQKAFQYFEAAYTFARDICGLAAATIAMPCSFDYNIPDPTPSGDYIKQIQPELAANVNRLLHTLSAVLEQAKDFSTDYRTLDSLHQALVTFLPEVLPIRMELPDEDLTPLDIFCCVTQKEEMLATGLHQLQELSTHFCKLASYKRT